MKKRLQIAAVMLAGLLAAQPSIAALACQANAGCSMGMSEMGPNCPMTRSQAADACTPGCCDHAAAALSREWATLAKPEALAQNAVLSCARESGPPMMFSGSVGSCSLAASSPPRYILYRVFRI